LRDELVEGARVRAPAHELRLESVEERVLRVTQHHLDLLGGHRGDVARLFAEEQVRRGLPLAEGHVARTATTVAGATMAASRGSRTTSTASGRRSRTSLDEEPPDHGLGLRIVALADVPVPDDPLPVHEKQGGPRSHAERVQIAKSLSCTTG